MLKKHECANAFNLVMIAIIVCYSESGSTTLSHWEASLMSLPSSVSRVAVHLSVLESSVAWSRSVLHARCRICRRCGNADKMLLCDGCDRGHHTYCLKPPIKVGHFVSTVLHLPVNVAAELI